MQPEILPVLPLRDTVLFPPITREFIVSRSGSRAAVRAAMDTKLIVCIAQVADVNEEPAVADLYTMGTLARIKEVHEHEGRFRITLSALARRRVQRFTRSGPFLRAEVSPVKAPELADDANPGMDFLAGRVVGRIEMLLGMNKEQQFLLISARDRAIQADILASFADLGVVAKQSLLETTSTRDRLLKLLELTEPSQAGRD